MTYATIPSRCYVHASGKQASIYGSVPWLSDAEKALWTVKTVGWTVENTRTGQVGIGRAPWTTKEEADHFCATHRASAIGIGD